MRASCLAAVPALSAVLIVFSTAGILLETAFVDQPRVEAAFCRFHVCATSGLLDRARARTLDPAGAAARQAAQEFSQAVGRDSADAYLWCEAGQSLLVSGDYERAKFAFDRAVELAPNVSPVLLQVAGFQFRTEHAREALPVAARILGLVRDYDPVVFLLYGRSGLPTRELLRTGIPREPSAAASFFGYTIGSGGPAASREVWQWMRGGGLLNDRLASLYVNYLLRSKLYGDAVTAWVEYLGKRHGDYPEPNRLFNGDFGQNFSGAALDWTPAHQEHVEETRSSGEARLGNTLRITFDGKSNLQYEGISQIAVLDPGRYTLRVSMKTEGVTTDQGIAIRVFDPESPARLDVRSAQLVGSNDWGIIELGFTVHPGTNLVKVQFYRGSSWKFDNKLAGTVWIHKVKLLRTD